MHRWICILIICCLLSPALCLAEDFFQKKAEGWFWYKDPPSPPEKKEVKKPLIQSNEQAIEKPPETEKQPIDEPKPMSAVWIADNLPKYLNRALDEPSLENVSAYLYLQRLAVDKSQRFADQAQAAVIADPLLDENTRRPIATFGAVAADDQAAKITNKLMRELSERVGVWMFFRSDCPHCEKQAVVQKILKQKYGFATVPISLDGKDLQGMDLGPVRRDEGQADQLGVLRTPALFLANPATNEIVPLGQSMYAIDQMEKRILMAAASVGWITPGMFEDTRPAQGPLLHTPRNADPKRIKESPAALVDVLREQLTGGQDAK